MAFATRLELTEVDDAPQGDTRFPEVSPSDWQAEQRKPLSSASGLQGHFVSYRRRA